MAECCKPSDSAKNMESCPECGKPGRIVKALTVSVMVKDPAVYLHPEALPQDFFFLCGTKSCPIVYFNREHDISYSKSQLRIRVWQKENDPDVAACYCFNNSVSSIRREILEKGKSDVLSRISKKVKEGNCRCEVTNPQGSCCLGNVAKAVKLAQESLKKVELTNAVVQTKHDKART
ncbi:MAG: hypothetical protein M1368_00545 [Thaumarchaeota archaeon]|nr:hypothetical protein [Nitrososphaerota archaeon]